MSGPLSARVPVVPLAAAFAGGIAAAPMATVTIGIAVWAVTVLAAGALVALGRPVTATAVALLAVGAVGVLRAWEPPAPADHVSRLALPLSAQIEARLVDEPIRWTPDRARLLVEVERVDGETRTGTMQLTAYGPIPPLATGQRIAAEARLDQPRGFRNPGTFDYAERLQRLGIGAVGSARGAGIVALDEREPPWPARFRRRAVTAMREALPPVSAALLAGLLLGERTDLPPDVDAAFRRAGVYHVLAVSGFNVALVAATVWALLALARAPRRVAALGALAVVVAFAAVVGAQPSVLRATLMAVLVLLALLLEREASVLNSLAVAALAILAVRPADLHDPGFQLSFAATAGIVLAPMPRGRLAAALAVSAAAQLAVLPIGLSHFNQLSTIGLLANLGVVPLAGLATVLGLVAIAAGFASEVLAGWLFSAAWPILIALRGVVALAAMVPGAVVHLPAPGPVAGCAYVLALALGLGAWHLRETRRRARWLTAGAVGLVVLSALATLGPALRPADGRLRVSVLDVGQGDAIVVEGPDGRTVLVDAGAGGPYRLDVGERVVAPFLWNRGVLRLAAAVVTHDDADHAGGMAAVRERFSVRERWDGAADAGPLALGGAIITPLAGAGSGHNDASHVLRVDFGLVSVLLASDIEAAGEQTLVSSRVPLAAAVLKVPHHGSRTSSGPALLAAVRPSIALVSVGARNTYGHPDPGVLARLAAAGADIYRTDRDGALLLETDGRALTITRWASRSTTRYCLDPETPC